MRRRKRYLIVSANGYGNPGDDACGYGSELLIKRADNSAVTHVVRPPFKEYQVDWADIVVLGGGGIIYDESIDNVDNYLQFLRYAQEQGKKTIVLGVGVQGGPGGISTNYGKKSYREVLNKCDLVTVRSPKDREQLEAIGCVGIHVTQDIGFTALGVADSYAMHLHDIMGIGLTMRKAEKPKLGLSILDRRDPIPINEDFINNSLNLASIWEKYFPSLMQDFDVYLLTHSADDRKFNFELSKKHGFKVIDYKKLRDFPRLQSAYKHLDLIITERFHPMIFGSLHKKPVITIGGDNSKHEKLSNFNMKRLKQNYIDWTRYDDISHLFANLRGSFDEKQFLPSSDEEIIEAVRRVESNVLLMKSLA